MRCLFKRKEKEMKKKRVFHIISHFDVGGAERVAVNIAKSDNPQIEYHVVELIRAHSPFTRVFINELQQAGISYHRFIVPQIHFHYLFERIAAVLFPLWFVFIYYRYRPAVIHSHTEMPDLAVYLFFRLFPRLLHRCRVVRTIHSSRLWEGLHSTGRRVEAFMKECHANVAISDSVQDNYRLTYGECPPIIHNGMAPVEQHPYPHIIAGKQNILFAGRFEQEKGIATLIEIIKALRDDSRYHFHLFGDGTLRKGAAQALSDCRNVTFNAPLYGIAGYMQSFQYMIMPSEFEGLSILSIEASFNGLPVIINSCPGLRDTLPADWSLQVIGNALSQYLDIFQRILPAAQRQHLCSQAHDFVDRHFGVHQMRRRYEAIYLDARE